MKTRETGDSLVTALPPHVLFRVWLFCCAARSHDAQSVAFINPGKSDEIYWMTATQGMQAVARSLGMTFEVQYAQREPLKTFEIAREMVARAAWETARLYRAHGRLFRGRPAPEDHRPHRGENLSRLQLDSRRPARRHRIAPRQIQRLARLAGAAGGGRRRSDGGRADRARQEGKGVRARRQASHAGDCRRSLHTLVDQTQSGHAPRGRGKSDASFWIRRSTRPGPEKKPPSKPIGSTSAIRTPGSYGRVTT